MRRMDALRACGAALLVVSLAGCVKMDMQLELNSDDTVDGDMIVAFDRSISDLAESMGEDPLALFDEMQTDLPDNTEAEPYEDDEFVGQRYIIDGADLSDFAEDDTGFGIVHEDGEFVVNGEMDMSHLDPSQVGEGMGQEFGPDIDPEALLESFDVSLSITFPGEVIEHNGELDGTTVTWTPQMGENLEINARAEDSGAGGMPVWAWIVIALVVVAALAALLFFLSRSRGQGEATAGEAATAGATPPPPPAGTAANTGETPSSAAEAAAVQVADDTGRSEHPHGTPLGAEDAELPADAAESTPVDAPDAVDTSETPDTPEADGDERR